MDKGDKGQKVVALRSEEALRQTMSAEEIERREIVARIDAMPAVAILDFIFDTRAALRSEGRKVDIAEQILQSRMEHEGKLEIASADRRVKRVRKRTAQTDVTTLLQLRELKQDDGIEPLIPADELEAGLTLVVPERPDPFWKSNLTKLKPLAKYGNKVAEILQAATVYLEGPETLEYSEKKG